MAGWTPEMKRAARAAAKIGADPVEAAHSAFVPGNADPGNETGGLPSWVKYAVLAAAGLALILYLQRGLARTAAPTVTENTDPGNVLPLPTDAAEGSS